MDELRQNEFAWEPFVGRGALGGTIGMLVVVAIGTAYVVLRYGTNSLIEMIVIMGVMGLVSGQSQDSRLAM
jgi:hypothetical protein